MHRLSAVAVRAHLKGAEGLVVPDDTSLNDAWEIVARTLGLTTDELASSLAPAFGIVRADFQKSEPSAVSLLSERIARQYQVFPLREDGRRVVVATADPTNFEAEHAIGFATGRRVVLELATPAAINDALMAAHNGELAMDQLLNSIDEELLDAVRTVEEDSPETIAVAEIDSAPVVKLTNLM